MKQDKLTEEDLQTIRENVSPELYEELIHELGYEPEKDRLKISWSTLLIATVGILGLVALGLLSLLAGG